MVLNYIWLAFFLTAFAVASVRLIFFGDTTVFPDIINSTFASSKTAFEISLGLTGVLSLWLGIMKIGEMGGVVNWFARILSPCSVNFSRYSERTSCHRKHFHEPCRQHAGAG